MELEDQFGIKISDDDAQKITHGRTGSRLRHRRTSKPPARPGGATSLAELIAALSA